MLLAVAADERRSCRWEKLTPRLPRPTDREMTGGLLGQCELVREDRDMDRRRLDVDRLDGVLRFDEPRDMAVLRLELLRSVRTRRELVVR
jgi:hypothetical protein